MDRKPSICPILAFRIAEDKRVSLPVQVNLDGFTMSHVIEPMTIPDAKEIRKFLPPFKPVLRLDPANPVTIGAGGHAGYLHRIPQGPG